MTKLETMHFAPIDALPAMLFCPKIKSHKSRYIQLSVNISRNSDDDLNILKISVYRIAGAQAAVISRFGDRI